MGNGAVKGRTDNNTTHTANEDGEHLKRTNSTSNMSCEGCSVSFSIFKRKHTCKDCGRQHCSTCLPKEASLLANKNEPRTCKKCVKLRSGNFTRMDLTNYRVRELRLFLARHNVRTAHCKEKNDLVELALGLSNNSQHFREQEENRRRTEELQERRRQDEVFQSTQPEPAEDTGPSESDPAESAPPENETNEQFAERLRRRQQEEMEQAESRLREEGGVQESPSEARPARTRINLKELGHEESIDDLTVRQLKEVLVANFVDYKGCCEKAELVERVKRLWNDKQTNVDRGEVDTAPDSEVCKICMDALINCVLLECGHMVTCTDCGKQLNECPICRQYVVRVVHIFKA